jgi:hypothetical protein
MKSEVYVFDASSAAACAKETRDTMMPVSEAALGCITHLSAGMSTRLRTTNLVEHYFREHG